MNVDILHEKIKLDPLVTKLGAVDAFDYLWRNDIDSVDAFIEIYFKDLDAREKIEIVRKAGMFVLATIKKTVSEQEYLTLLLFNDVLDVDKAQILQMMESKERAVNDEINTLKNENIWMNNQMTVLSDRLSALEQKDRLNTVKWT